MALLPEALLAALFALWFWFSLSPDSPVGFPITAGGWTRRFTLRDDRAMGSKQTLRSMGTRAFITHAGIFLVVLGVHPETSSWLPAAATGVLASYAFLMWSTRASGWYGEA